MTHGVAHQFADEQPGGIHALGGSVLEHRTDPLTGEGGGLFSWRESNVHRPPQTSSVRPLRPLGCRASAAATRRTSRRSRRSPRRWAARRPSPGPAGGGCDGAVLPSGGGSDGVGGCEGAPSVGLRTTMGIFRSSFWRGGRDFRSCGGRDRDGVSADGCALVQLFPRTWAARSSSWLAAAWTGRTPAWRNPERQKGFPRT